MAVRVEGPLALKLEGPQPSRVELQSLRDTVAWLRREGLLLETEVEVSNDLELTGIQKHLDGTLPILFHNVRGYPHHQLVTNLFTNMRIVERWFGWADARDRTRKLAHALTHPIAPVVVPQDEAPCQEEVFTQDLEVNRYVVPIRHTALESELTVGSGCSVVVGDLFHGGSHIGYNRMNFRWGNVGTFQSAPGSHMWQVITEHYRDPDGIPITMCFGIPVAANLIAGGGFDYVILPRGGDELGAAGAVQGFPIRLVKARTVDAYALADCELVLEGYIRPRDKRYETREAEEHDVQGRYHFHPEWAGYMGKAYKAPTFHVTAITRRRPANLLYPLGVHMLDCNNIDTTVREAAIFELCERLQPGIVQDVNIPFCMTDWGGCIIQVKKRNRIEEGWQRNFLVAAMSCSQGMRLAIAVDTDIDIYSMDDIVWALTTRVNPHTDILNPVPGGIGQTFMPEERLTAGERPWTASNTRFEGGIAIDATIPFGYENDFLRPVYPVQEVDPRRWFGQAELDQVRSLMEGWVTSLARTGR
ncbi:MAG TPA: UbiD family decarboxylase [Candidatus Dormibacteraeota bacterium]|jgi:UbiD family decarboxylase|nr:UbiD family decarboxylase [Candidatus Dormibacteraeota bacterium]